MKKFLLAYHKIFALCFFIAISFLYFEIGVIKHLFIYSAGGDTTDVFAGMWFFAWWPYALIHHLNPFICKLIWAPSGLNLTKINTAPALALIFMPVTLIWGPVISYNLAVIFPSAFAAWTAYLLLRYIFKSPWLSMIGGYFFGYSCYVISEMFGHLCLVAPAVLLPLFPLLILMRFNHEISMRRFIIFYTIALIFLYLFEIEVFATFSFWGGISFLIAILIFKEKRQALIQLIKPIFFSYLMTILFVSPFLYYYLSDSSMMATFDSPAFFSADLLSLFIPSPVFSLVTHGASQLYFTFTGDEAENSTYFGIVFIVIFLLFIKQFWKTAWGKYLTIISLIFIVASLGPTLHIAGFTIFSFPWRFIFNQLPLLHNALPMRLGVYASLSLAICLVAWLKYSSISPKKRAILLGFGLLFLFPSFSQQNRPTFSVWPNPPFFSNHLYEKYLTLQDNVLILPYKFTPEMAWQAESKFSFRSTLGYLGSPPNDYVTDPVFSYFSQIKPTLLTKEQLAFFLYRHGVTKIIVPHRQFYSFLDHFLTQWNPLLTTIDKAPVSVGGVTIYTVDRQKMLNILSPSCPTFFNFSSQLGSGWSGVEKQPNGDYAMWMDSKRATLHLLSACDGSVVIQLHILGYMRQDILDHLTISVNNHLIPFIKSTDQDHHIILKANTSLASQKDHKMVEFIFSVPRTIHAGGPDGRELAIMFSKIEVRNNP